MSIVEPASFTEGAAASTTEIKRVVLSSVIGTAVEWYDFLIYGTATALVFNKLFFPLSDPGLSTLAAFGTYAVGFLARPLGAAIFGHYGDRIGRKTMLATTIVIMGLGTFLIGLLPTYDQIGIAAPVLLVVLRLLQGIGLGGEWGGAVLMVVESASTRNRGVLGSMVQIGWPIGNLAAIGIFAALSQVPESAFLAWAWRIPFLISIVLVGIGLYIRLQLHETPVFREIVAKNEVVKIPLAEILACHRRSFFTAIGLKLSEVTYAIVAGVFSISYVTNNLALPRSVIINAIFLAAVVALPMIPVFGWLSDRIGRKGMFYASCLFSIAFAFPMFWLLDTKDPFTITLTIVVAITFGQMIGFAVGPSWYSELFAARLRYSGASLGFQIGAAIGGLTPFAATAFMVWTGGATWLISAYLMVVAAITWLAAAVAPETARKPLN
ncbi:MFS transporter [Bradyrhizobium sp. NAS96.2]|uniref:MFS transporter n=1 Tax=Bradyrhizobium sp. NAS96.2 TaxID=1680160 RepID=UPI0009405A79|nr:MFS transporter [Bradyrhizobium sp. NAS96.2]OKO69739.1 MFS transporter [Bradyrhizobium sp. NAS96.2]